MPSKICNNIKHFYYSHKIIINNTILFIFFISPSLIIFFCILYDLDLKYDLSFTFTKKGFETFSYLFRIPLKLFWHGILAYGILVALLKFYSSEKLYKLNLQAFKDDYRPFVLCKNINSKNSNNQLIFNFINSGRHSARIVSLHIDYNKENNQNHFSTNRRDITIIVHPQKSNNFKIKLSDKKFAQFLSWFEQEQSTFLNIFITYQGLHNENYKTQEIWRINNQSKKPILINSIWSDE